MEGEKERLKRKDGGNEMEGNKERLKGEKG